MLLKILVALIVAGLAWMVITRLTRPAARQNVGNDERGSLEMAPCSVCGAYVSAEDQAGCGRADCPRARQT